MAPFKNILYVCENTVSQVDSIKRAVSLAENNQADLTVIDVIALPMSSFGTTRGGLLSDEMHAAATRDRRERLEALVAPYTGQIKIRLDVLVGRTFLEAIRVVLRNGHDLLVKPAENPTFIERLFGSDDMQLLRNCPCPVWLTRENEKPKYQNILAAVDFDPEAPDAVEDELNTHILDLAGSIAMSDFAALHVLHVWDAPNESTIRKWSNNPQEATAAYVGGVLAGHESAFIAMRQELAARMGSAATDYLSADFHLRRGAAATVIPETARQLQTDIVIMGTVARTGIAGLLIGNTAEAVLEQLQCSVLAVKPPGFVSPVRPA